MTGLQIAFPGCGDGGKFAEWVTLAVVPGRVESKVTSYGRRGCGRLSASHAVLVPSRRGFIARPAARLGVLREQLPADEMRGR
jgi:hypothetical protein